MATRTLSQEVNPGDLILACGPAKALMVHVKSAPGSSDPNPSTSSIVVKVVDGYIPRKKGHWTLSGPVVYYLEEDEEGDGSTSSDDCSEDHREQLLGDVLASLAEIDENKDETRQVFSIVNPHGRDVLKHFYKGCCPWCKSTTWFCPGCGGVSQVYPELFASCGYDMSCPVCMGYEFALEDKSMLQYLDPLEFRLFMHKGSPEQADLSETELQDLKEEVLQYKKERHERINSRREEMGRNPEDFEKQIQEFKESYC